MADGEPKTWADRNGRLVLQVVAVVLTAILSAIAAWTGKPVPPPVLVERAVPFPALDEFAGIGELAGWVNDPDESWAAAQALDVQVFAATPAGQAADADLPKAVYLWQAHERLTGRKPPLKDQNPTGSCVGFGTTTAVERTLAAEVAARNGLAGEFSLFSEEVTYAGSRVEANGGTCPIRRTRDNPDGDGSNGGWAAKFVTRWGMVPKGRHGPIDLTEYSAARARSWNYSGVPDALEPVARLFPVRSAARVTSWRDAKKALASGYAGVVCSSQGFDRQRDANGVAAPRGRWAHAMCLDGYHTAPGGREYGHIENSWSRVPPANVPYHVGPTGWGDPTGAGFWADAEVIDRMLREGDSYFFSGATGFPRKDLPLDWVIRRDHDPFARPVLALRGGGGR